MINIWVYEKNNDIKQKVAFINVILLKLLRPPTCMVQLKNGWIDFDKFWYWRILQKKKNVKLF
jgi:hypothetical protein